MTPSDIRAILVSTAGLDTAYEDGDDLLESGALDSISAMKAIAALETAFGVKIPASDVTYENFQSIDAIAAYLKGIAA